MNITDARKLALGQQAERLEEGTITAGAIAVIESRRDRDSPFDALDERDVKRLGVKLRQIAYEVQHQKKLDTGNLDSTDTDTLTKIAKSALENVAGPVEEGGALMKYIGLLGETLWAGLRFAFLPIIEVLGDALLLVVEAVLGSELLIPLAAVLGVGGAVWLGYKAWSDRDKDVKEVSKTPSSSPPPTPRAAEVPIAASAALNVRLNNPGNIEYRDSMTGLGAYKREGPKGRYAGFRTQAQGLYAIGHQLEVYHNRDKLSTIRELAEKYAPRKGPDHNNTDAYIKNVSSWMHVGPDDKLDFSDPDTMARMIRAMVRQENGMTPYTEEQYQAAGAASARYGKGEAVVVDGDVTDAAMASPEMIANAAKDTSIGVPTSGVFSSPFGMRTLNGRTREHKGIDIAAAPGTPVYAATTGIVTVKPSDGEYGNSIEILNRYFSTKYGHLSSFGVKSGDYAMKGQRIGAVGNTGDSTGPHLHFEVRPATMDYKPVDPGNYLVLPKVGKRIDSQTASVPLPPDLGGSEVVNLNGKLVKIRN